MTKSDKTFVSVKELIEIAIDFEVDSAQFYREIQKRIADEKTLELLKLLEDQELEHERILRKFEIGPGPHAILQFAPSFSFAMPTLPKNDLSIFELLDIAIKREKKTAEIYENSANLVSGDLKKLLNGLATFEYDHEFKLNDLKAYLKSEEKY